MYLAILGGATMQSSSRDGSASSLFLLQDLSLSLDFLRLSAFTSAIF